MFEAIGCTEEPKVLTALIQIVGHKHCVSYGFRSFELIDRSFVFAFCLSSSICS